MMIGTVLTWNPETGRGLIESRFDGTTFKFTLACILHPQDCLNMRQGITVFFDSFERHAPKVEIASSSFRRFVSELETDPNANYRVLA